MSSVPSAEALALAERALDEMAPKGAVGEVLDAVEETESVLLLRYRSLLEGYPDWSWTVAVAIEVEGAPTVLEVALLPESSSLVAPEWVPWADRLAEYLATKEQEAADAAQGSSDGDADADGDDFDDFDEDDLPGDGDDDLGIDEEDSADDDADSAADDSDATDDDGSDVGDSGGTDAAGEPEGGARR